MMILFAQVGIILKGLAIDNLLLGGPGEGNEEEGVSGGEGGEQTSSFLLILIPFMSTFITRLPTASR